eukprot:354497-Chlamydomonas_euryale.AAC.2
MARDYQLDCCLRPHSRSSLPERPPPSFATELQARGDARPEQDGARLPPQLPAAHGMRVGHPAPLRQPVLHASRRRVRRACAAVPDGKTGEHYQPGVPDMPDVGSWVWVNVWRCGGVWLGGGGGARAAMHYKEAAGHWQPDMAGVDNGYGSEAEDGLVLHISGGLHTRQDCMRDRIACETGLHARQGVGFSDGEVEPYLEHAGRQET